MKVKGFTLLELLVGMIVSSIVISACYIVYNMVYIQYDKYKLVRGDLINFMSFNNELENDFYHSNNIRINEKELIFEFADKSVNIVFIDSIVIRKDSQVVDTFKVTVKDFELVENTDGLVTSLHITSVLLEENVDLYFNKKYSAEELMNYMKNKKEYDEN